SSPAPPPPAAAPRRPASSRDRSPPSVRTTRVCQGNLASMGRRGPWESAKQAWERLQGWVSASHADGGGPALEALDDIGEVRRVLDQAELEAVRTARRHGRSWAEIATRLGVTRQSAWERWRDLDEPATAARTPEAMAAALPLDDIVSDLA